MTTRSDFDDAMDRVGVLLAAAEQNLPPPALEATRGLVDAVLTVHREGLRLLLQKLAASPGGDGVVRDLSSLPEVEGLLLLHGLHPEPFDARVRRAVRDADIFAGKGGIVELTRLSGNSASVRVAVSEAEGAAVKEFLETRLGETAPECELTLVDSDETSATLIPLARLTARGTAP
jgi:hypothetical protein